MRSAYTARVAIGVVAIVLLLGAIGPGVLAQGAGAPGSPGLPSGPPSAPAADSPGDGGTRAAVLVGGFLALGLVIAWVKLLDLRRKRNDEAVNVQSQISDTLLRDRTLGPLPVAPTVHVPIWPHAPATIELRGQVPAVELREAVVRVADHEASRLLGSYHIEDRLTVAPAGAHAA
jgi:hypothetical protein